MPPIDLNLDWTVAGVVLTVFFGALGLVITLRARGTKDIGTTSQHMGDDVSRPPGQTMTGDIQHQTINNNYYQYLGRLPETRDPYKKALLEQGLAHQKKKEHQEAICAFRSCLARENSSVERAALHLLLGNSFYLQSRLLEAEWHYKEAVAAATEGWG